MDQESGWADQAMKRMAKEALSPTPHHFAIWYGYYSGEVPDLIRAIDLDATASKPFTPDRMEELYGKFFSFDREQRAVLQAGMRIQDALGQLLELLRSSGADTDRYGKALQQFGARLELPGLEQLRSLVDAIASETKLVAQQNQRLQDQLHLSGAQMEELKRNLDSVRQESITDSLTGLFNRRKFDETLQEAASRSVQTGSPLCLLMTDIDHFKKFNDNYGHTIGDHVLALVARTVKECIRSSDTPVRYGGEEFAVILPNTSAEGGRHFAESLRAAVEALNIPHCRSRYGVVTVSIGLACELPIAGTEAAMLQNADAALYSAKESGRNRAKIFDGSTLAMSARLYGA
jgi:diguanylate cyclase